MPHSSPTPCASCDFPLEEGDRFCPECGAPVINTRALDALYNEAFFEKIEAMTTPTAALVAGILREHFRPESVVDVGCGSGIYLREFQHLGCTPFGVDAALAGLERMSDIPWKRHDLHQPLRLEACFDLCICFETAEHLHPHGARPLVESLSRLADAVAFSAAAPEQGGDGHFNEMPLSYWMLLFREFGFELAPMETGILRDAFREADAPFWLPHNFAVFRRSPVCPAELTRELARVSPLSGWLSEGEAALLASCVRSLSARQEAGHDLRIVELGSWHGKSTVALAEALESTGNRGTVHAVDHHTGDPALADFLHCAWGDIFSWPCFESTIELQGLKDRVVPVIADTLAAAASWQDGAIDFLFIDGDHAYEAVRKNFAAWRGHLHDDSLVAWHDTTNLDGPCRFVRELIDEGALRGWVQVDSITLGRVSGISPARPVPSVNPGTRDTPLISIILAHRNEGTYLKQTLDSLIAHTYYPHFEILILDDASTDDSCTFLRDSPYQEDPRIRLITHQEPQGYLALRRQAVPICRGEVLQFIDAHHSFTDYWLTNSHDALKRRDYRAIIGQVVTNLDVDTWQGAPHACYGWHIDRMISKIWPGQWHEVGPDGRVPAITGHQLMVSKAGYEDIGGFLPCFVGHGGEDIEFSLRAARVGYDCFVEPTALIAHLFKTSFMNPVVWSDVILNQLITVFVNFGPDAMNTCVERTEATPHLHEALQQFESLKPSLAEVLTSVESKSVLSPAALLARLPDLENKEDAHA